MKNPPLVTITGNFAGTINPGGAGTNYYFKWGTTTLYGKRTEWKSLGYTDNTFHAVSANPTLAAGTRYHWRLVAKNRIGVTPSPDQTFIEAEPTPDPTPTPAPSDTLTYKGVTYRLPLGQASDWTYSPTGTTYWVAKTGSDGWMGTEASPFLTITKAVSVAVAGDCIYVKAGTYSEQVTTIAAGTAGHPIVLSVAPEANGGGLGTVTIHNPAFLATGVSVCDGIVTVNKNYVTVNGFVLLGSVGLGGSPPLGGPDAYSECGVGIVDGAGTGVRITNCVADLCLHCGFKEGHHGGTGFVIEGCLAVSNGLATRDHGFYIPSDGAVIKGNLSTGAQGYGFHYYGGTGTGTASSYNVAFGNALAGFICAESALTFDHDTDYNNGLAGFFAFAGMAGCTRKNSISSGNTGGRDFGFPGHPVADEPTGNTDSHNLYQTGGTADLANYQFLNTLTGRLSGDPKFVDPTGVLTGVIDFRLQAGSPALAAGLDGLNLGAFV